MDSKKAAAALLIDPTAEPEPFAETGPGTHFGNTFSADKKPVSQTSSPIAAQHQRSPSGSTDPRAHRRLISGDYGSGQRPRSPAHERVRSGDHGYSVGRERAVSDAREGRSPPIVETNGTPESKGHRRRGSSLSPRFPGDESHKPLDVIRRHSKKAARSPHLNKRTIPGPDLIDRLDPAIGGVPYHHEGPYDAALLSRNSNKKYAPIEALTDTNKQAIDATPHEAIEDAVRRHRPLDGTAMVPPGVPDRFGRTYNYEEGTDMMREGTSDAGYKRWPGTEYHPDDLKGKGEPQFSLDRALRAHHIDDRGDIELSDRTNLDRDYMDKSRKGQLDARDPVEIAGDDAKYAELEQQQARHGQGESSGSASGSGLGRSGSLKQGLKKRFGSLRHKNNKAGDDDE